MNETDTVIPTDNNDNNEMSTWTLERLLTLAKSLLECNAPYNRFFVLIDGLDELDEDYSKILELLSELSAWNVKLLVASRPESAFDRAFSKMPRLELQELTRNDIVRMVLEKLSTAALNHVERVKFPNGRKDLIRLGATIINQANGIFLWAKTVAGTCETGILEGESIQDLERHVTTLPNDMLKLYRQLVLRAIDKYDHQQMLDCARYCQLAIVFPRPPVLSLNVLALCPLTSAQLGDFKVPDLTAFAERCKQKLLHIRARGLGLLEIWTPHFTPQRGKHSPTPSTTLEWVTASTDPNTTIRVAHRTVQDFLKQDAILSELAIGDDQWTSEVCKLRGYIRWLEFLSSHVPRLQPHMESTYGQIYRNVSHMLWYICYIEHNQQIQLTQGIFDLVSAADALMLLCSSVPNNHEKYLQFWCCFHGYIASGAADICARWMEPRAAALCDSCSEATSALKSAAENLAHGQSLVHRQRFWWNPSLNVSLEDTDLGQQYVKDNPFGHVVDQQLGSFIALLRALLQKGANVNELDPALYPCLCSKQLVIWSRKRSAPATPWLVLFASFIRDITNNGASQNMTRPLDDMRDLYGHWHRVFQIMLEDGRADPNRLFAFGVHVILDKLKLIDKYQPIVPVFLTVTMTPLSFLCWNTEGLTFARLRKMLLAHGSCLHCVLESIRFKHLDTEDSQVVKIDQCFSEELLWDFMKDIPHCLKSEDECPMYKIDGEEGYFDPTDAPRLFPQRELITDADELAAVIRSAIEDHVRSQLLEATNALPLD
ncbi:MAG: hypothetical protein Q9162_003406 [Coniocarpon cinnabarinum]